MESHGPAATPGQAVDPSWPVPASGAARVVEIVQTVLVGLILAFMMRAFLVEPFIIPTGSMAESLLGAHATRTCPACGWEFVFAPLRSASPAGAGFVCPDEIICPNCQLRWRPTARETIPGAGDRILVHKWPYVLGLPKPQRWDVIVFRDPGNPDQHYIKRLVGLPGETIEIIDGDLFINGQIARKPPYVQRMLWFVVFDQAHLPNRAAASGRLPRWATVDTSEAGQTGWSGLESRVIRYDGLDRELRKIAFEPETGREYLFDLYAYNRGSSGTFVGDVRVTCELMLRDGDGRCRWELTRPPYRFSAELRRNGTLKIGMESPGNPGVESVVGTRSLPPFELGRPIAVEFGHLDYRVYLKIDGCEMLATSDSDYTPHMKDLRDMRAKYAVEIGLGAENLRLELRGLRIDRDVHYTRTVYSQRASAGDPFTLGEGEYFVLGDNSPDSHDSREWTESGPHLPADYRPGTVRADQIVGQAAFVYLPSLLSVDAGGRWFVPDLGRVRFVR